MLITVLLTGSYVFAHDFEVNGIYYKILSEDDKILTVTIQGSSYSEYSNEYTGIWLFRKLKNIIVTLIL